MINIRTFRANMPKLLREAQKKNVHFVVMRHAVPVAKVTPLKVDHDYEALVRQVARGRRDARLGRVYTLEEVRRHLGL
jgi:antitoxin (DNA-binding transcriptional repressor) of toxin-antitoxin stability system